MDTVTNAGKTRFALPEGTVYIRTVLIDELDSTVEVPAGIDRLYAIHDQSGRRIGLFDDRNAAFALARNNELSPVSVH